MIEIYSSPTCVYCANAKQLLDQRGIMYRERVIGEDVTREQFTTTYPNIQSLPAIFVSGNYIGGFSQLQEWVNNNGKQLLVES